MEQENNKDLININAIILVEENGKVDFEIDQHKFGVFAIEDIQNIMETTGFEISIYNNWTKKNTQRHQVAQSSLG